MTRQAGKETVYKIDMVRQSRPGGDFLMNIRTKYEGSNNRL
jgi:hypothetical protein